jgi:hypothetical protein
MTVRRHLRHAGLLACLCTLASLSATAGELYQWTDANGVTHYSDSPPPNRQDYQSRGYIGQKPAPAQPEQAEPELAASSQCTTARTNLALLQSEGPVGIDNDKDGKPDGQLDPGQRAAQAALAEAAIKVHCAEATAAS